MHDDRSTSPLAANPTELPPVLRLLHQYFLIPHESISASTLHPEIFELPGDFSSIHSVTQNKHSYGYFSLLPTESRTRTRAKSFHFRRIETLAWRTVIVVSTACKTWFFSPERDLPFSSATALILKC